jgi:hypothetical protein
MTINRTPALPNADSRLAAFTPLQPVGRGTSNDTPHSQTQNTQGTMASIDGLDDGSNAWSNEGRDNLHPSRPLPDALRVGPPGGPPSNSQAAPQPNTNTNPYIQKQSQGIDSNGNESSANAWEGPAELPALPSENRLVGTTSNGVFGQSPRTV